MSIVKINCIYNESSAWCKNENIKKSIFGLGAKVCVKYENGLSCKCEYETMPEKPKTAPRNKR